MADRFQIELLGQNALLATLLGAADGAPEVLGQALYQEGQMAFKRSQKEVPVRKGYLKNSGRLSSPTTTRAGNTSVNITYGSAAAKYAAPVHNLDKNYRNGRKWHYVEDPVMGRIPGLEGRLAKRIKRIMGGT